ncbi:MAG: ATP-dependent RNA helicase DbpA [Campylobacterota bacterium]|nr:ATP-dependent RNA helicase DbpA [Campylobacterota bacterium]
MNNFNNLNIDKDMITNLSSLGFDKMTQIQEMSLPSILDGEDVIAKAKTGSGKTVSFGLGVLYNLKSERFRIQSLILCPTRELASQVAKTLKDLARYKHNIKILTLTGGVPYKPQVHSLSHKAHIIVGTPGRILKHLKEESFSCDDINTLVLDEADRMLDMGFSEDIMEIIGYLPTMRQSMLFSATYPQTIEQMSSSILCDPKMVEVESTHSNTTIVQEFYKVDPYQKPDLLPMILDDKYQSTIIFCNTKVQCNELADFLDEKLDIDILVLHSDLDQKDRDETLIMFSNKSFPILIATDVASRGLDIDDVDLVINYDLPHDFEVYTHRIGRTARAGKSGCSVSLVEDELYFDDLNDFLNGDFKLQNIDKLNSTKELNLISEYSTLYINGGKRHKLRAGDILGALTAGIGLDKTDIGKIDILPTCSYVAIKNGVYDKAYEGLRNNRMKNKYYRIYKR